jgi:hypothetical protein
MANLFELLTRIKNNQEYEPTPITANPIKPIQMNEDGSIREIPQPIEKPVTLGERVNNALFGIKAMPTDSVGDLQTNSDGTAQVDSTVSQSPRVGGFFNDFSQGYRENRTTPISLDNFGNKKNFATRFGEGLGSLARIAESPAGRALMVGGLVAATGGGGLPALAFGSMAGLGNQQNRMKDRLYRQELEKQGVDTSQIRGYITDDTFKNYSLANYRNRNLDVKLQLGMLKNNTDRAKLINMLLNNGMMDPSEAVQRMGEYGINVTELDESNQTKLLPYRQYALKNGWDLGWVNFKLKQDAQNIKNDIIKDLMGGGNNPPKHKTNAF